MRFTCLFLFSDDAGKIPTRGLDEQTRRSAERSTSDQKGDEDTDYRVNKGQEEKFSDMAETKSVVLTLFWTKRKWEEDGTPQWDGDKPPQKERVGGSGPKNAPNIGEGDVQATIGQLEKEITVSQGWQGFGIAWNTEALILPL